MAASRLKIPEQPTNGDIIRVLAELHECVEGIGGDVSAVKTEVGHVSVRLARVEGYQEGMAVKLKVPSPDSPPPGFWRKHRNPMLLTGAVLASATAFASGYPVLRVALLAVDAYLMHPK